jgi:hypothetical protein
MRKERVRQTRASVSSRSIGIYRPPAVGFNGMSDGIRSGRRAGRETEQTVEWFGDDRVGVTGRSVMLDPHHALLTRYLHRKVSRKIWAIPAHGVGIFTMTLSAGRSAAPVELLESAGDSANVQ